MCGDLYFWRQIFILTTTLLYAISTGLMIAFPSVLNPALMSSNTTELRANSDQASWIAASNGFAGVIGFFILSPVLQLSGRKAIYIACNLLLLIGWIIFPLANSIASIYAARIIQGISNGAVYIDSMIIGEYVDRTRRAYFTTTKKVFIAIGILICHSMSSFLDWRQISAYTVFLPTVSIILTLFWPESPSHLALKGRFKDCEESFIWLNGRSKMKELHHLMLTQKERIKNQNSKKSYKYLLKKEFLKPLLIVSLLTCLLDLCGRYFFVVYVIQIMVELIGDKSIAIYCTLGADCLTIIALASSCFLIAQYKRRTILLSFGSMTIPLMLLISLILLLKSFNIGTSLIWLTPLMLILQNFIVNLGLIPVSFSIIGEIFPLEYKGSGSCISGIVFTLLYAFTLKLTPILIENIGLGGTYAVYGVCIAVSMVLLHFMLPETKDKTLQEIEDVIKGVKTTQCEVETNALLQIINK